jgi:PAS domain S-box-containing protein
MASARHSADPAASKRGTAISLAALAAIPLILLLLAQLLSGEFEQSRHLRQEVDRSYQARFAIKTVLSLHQDLETGQRGFILTGDPAFLEPYRTARGKIEQAVVRIAQDLPADSPILKAIPQLRAQSAAKLDFTDRTIRLRQTGRGAAAEALIASGRGRALMDSIRRRLAWMDASEQRRLLESTRRADEARLRSQHLTFGLLTVLAVLLFGASWANRRSMEARKQALRRLEDLTARQEAIFDNAKDGIITLNRSGSIESLNYAAARMYGYEPEELVRRDIGILFEVAPDQGDVETFLKRLQRRRRGDLGRVQEFWGRRRDGSTFPSDVAVSPVPLADGLRYVAIIRDVTERKQVDQMKSEFVSTVSHELRTPLTSIAGSLGLLSGGAAGELPERAIRLIKIAHSNSERLVRLINDILDIEKIESGKIVFNIAPVPLRPLLEQAVQANQAFAEEFGVSLAIEPGCEEAVVIADADRLMQVVTNLLSNAAKFSPAGEVVTVAVTPLDRRYRISVQDRGPGIPEEFKARIFSKFAQADSSDTRQKGGTGLGLSIVREIVTRLGGAVGFDSPPEGGTIFYVDLPAEETAFASPVMREGEPSILHIDDDPDVLRVVASAFDGRARLHSAPSLESARAALADSSFDLVILDVALSDGSGLDILPELRRRAGRAVPVVIFSAQDAGPELSAQVDAVLTKSRASLERLIETVEAQLAAAAPKAA